MGLILILCFLVLTLFLGMFISRKSYDYELAGDFMVIVSIILIVLLSISIVMFYFDYADSVEDFKAQKQTILQLKNNEMAQLERIKLAEKVIDVNGWLARTKYWNETFWLGIFIPDEVIDLNPIDYRAVE